MISYQAAAIRHLETTDTTHWVEADEHGAHIVAHRLDTGSRIRITSTTDELTVHRADPAGFPTGEHAVLRDCPEAIGAVIDALLDGAPCQDFA